MNPQYSKTRVAYLAHGRAGLECLQQLVFELGVAPSNLLVLTYARQENNALRTLCREQNIVCTTASIREPATVKQLTGFEADVVVSMHFRELIPEAVFSSARDGGFNLHPSLLPQYRGCFSGVWAIIQGESITGISYHFLNARFDDGKIVLQATLDIAADETGHSIFNRLIDLGVAHFRDAFERVVGTGFEGREQVGEASYFGRALPYDGVIDPKWPAQKIDRFIRALQFPDLAGAKMRTQNGLIEVSTFEQYQQLAANHEH